MSLTPAQIEQNVAAYRDWLNGKPIQWYSLSELQWKDKINSKEILNRDILYRPKPKPTIRPYNKEEMKELAMKSSRLFGKNSTVFGIVIGYICDIGPPIVNINGEWYRAEGLLDYWQHENGSPCGVEE